jgi:ABC-2 type transport system ATP-binding protein
VSIQVKHLSKFYGDQKAVDRISFDINKGEIVGFLGPNGAGKTTTMKMLSCYISPNEGSAHICGFDTQTNPKEVRSHIGYLPEHNPLYHDMYVREYLDFVAGIFKISNRQKRIEEIIELTALGVEQHKKIEALSKGYRQRVGLAQAILHQPEVLILDEPTSGLDPNQLAEIREVIKTLGQEKTVLLSSHIMQEIEAVCDRIIIINEGKMVADAPIDELKQRSRGRIKIKLELDHQMDEKRLASIAGVHSVKHIEKANYELWSTDQADIRPAVYQYIKSSNHMLLGMNKVELSVEEVFQALTTARTGE